MERKIIGILSVIGIIVVSIFDIVANVVSIIPWIGPALETITEIICEIIQIGLAIVIFAVGFLLGGKR